MLVKDLIDEDIANYKKISMFIAMPNCSFKCDKEAGCKVCQNSHLAAAPTIDVSYKEIADRYKDNSLTEAIILGGLEPFDSPKDIIELSKELDFCGKPYELVIYTGYTEEEIKKNYNWVYKLKCSLIIKFGRFIPNQESHLDKVLGVKLSSPNQYAKVIK